ncbi:MAG: hypothetical protein JOZ75_12645 [Candidatus Dormibacteraeota bacterium]|nr:hypothetical protein [Candidatus Dormibacteraeota bacterium]
MPLFRRRASEPEALIFTVGVSDHRVVVGGEDPGCRLLDDIDQYEVFMLQRQAPAGGRDSVGMLNAKLDYAELVDTTVAVLVLTFEELVDRGLMSQDEVPEKPAASALRRDLATYDYIQDAYTRACRRCEWVRAVDVQLRQHGVSVLWPQT